MVPNKKVERTPYEIWHGKAPKLSYLRVWGYEALVKQDAHDKLDPRSIKCIFVGYPKETMGYYFYYPLGNKIFVARNAEFFENSLIVQKDLNEPHNYKDALLDPEYDKWLKAMNTKMQSMKDNQVWILLELPPNGRTVGNIRDIRILLAIVVFYDYEILQMDAKTTFLNGYLSEDVYMVQPQGFMALNHPNKVCKLQRSIYGLKQAPRSWNKRFDVEIKKISFTQNPDEPYLYIKASRSSVAFLILYVDDILLIRNNVTMLQEVKSWLSKCFSMKDLGEATYILRIKIIRDRSKRLIALSQSAYLQKIQKKFRMENSKKGYTSMLEKPDYRKSQDAKTPNETIVKTILKCLRNTKDMVLVYGEKPEAEMKVSCYADANWKCAKQSTTAMSSTEAEYIVAAEASMEAVWMRTFIDGIGYVVSSNKRPMEMLLIQEREIVLKKVHTDDNVADPFTKPMSFDKHFEHAMAIGIVPASSLMDMTDVNNRRLSCLAKLHTQMATKGNLGEVVTTCEKSWVQASPWGFPSGAKKECGLSHKAKVRVLHTAQLNVTMSSNH
nr:hypothetical protein [Tanacetum cinerariifolium]